MGKKLLCMIILSSIFLTGCKEERPIYAPDAFSAEMKKNGMEVIDRTENTENCNAIYVATDNDKYTFELYAMKDKESLEETYDYSKMKLSETYRKTLNIGDDVEKVVTEVEDGFYIDDGTYFVKVSKKDNDMLYMSAYPDYKEEALEIAKRIGF